jgi:hypothetical protein
MNDSTERKQMYTQTKDKTRQILTFNNNSVSAIKQTISTEKSYMKHILGKPTTAEPIKRLPVFPKIGMSMVALATVCKY